MENTFDILTQFIHSGPAFLAIHMSLVNSIVAALIVISVANPVHGLLALVIAFISSVFTFILLGSPFFGLIFMIVYVGAIAMLFLFVIMLINIRITVFESKMENLEILLAFSGFILFSTVIAHIFWYFNSRDEDTQLSNWMSNPVDWITMAHDKPILTTLSNELYITYMDIFIILALLLLIALIATLSLAVYKHKHFKRIGFYLKDKIILSKKN